MSLQARRNSLFKSSISIKSIGDSVQKFSKSLRGARKNADESIKTIRQSNIFKKSLKIFWSFFASFRPEISKFDTFQQVDFGAK